MATIRPEEFTNDKLGSEYQKLHERCTSHTRENFGEGSIEATLRHMTDDVAQKKIIEIYTQLIVDRSPDILI
jgi:hypothetical protein